VDADIVGYTVDETVLLTLPETVAGCVILAELDGDFEADEELETETVLV
jgi:hypothetical protein